MIPAQRAASTPRGSGFEMPRNQKTGAAPPKTAKPKAAKRRKNGAGKRKAGPRQARPAKQPKPVRRLAGRPKDARAAIRKLRTELARARERCEGLEASADTR